MNRTGNAIRMAMARLKFKVTDSIHNFVWVVRQSFMFVARLPINIVRIIWFELMGLTFGLRNGIASTLRFFRQFFHLDGLWNLWYALLQTVYHLLRLPIYLFRFVIREILGLFSQLLDGLVMLTDVTNKALKYILYTIFISPIAWVIPFTSPQCCNAVVTRSRPHGSEIYVRYLLLIGTYRCRFCAKRSRRFWPVVEPRIREYELERQRAAENTDSSVPESSPQDQSQQG